MVINVGDINKRIEIEYCDKTSDELKDEKLLDKYKKCPSVKKN